MKLLAIKKHLTLKTLICVLFPWWNFDFPSTIFFFFNKNPIYVQEILFL